MPQQVLLYQRLCLPRKRIHRYMRPLKTLIVLSFLDSLNSRTQGNTWVIPADVHNFDDKIENVKSLEITRR